LIRFKAVNADDTNEEIIECNTIRDRIEKGDGEDSEWHFCSIDAHQELSRPLTQHTVQD